MNKEQQDDDHLQILNLVIPRSAAPRNLLSACGEEKQISRYPRNDNGRLVWNCLADPRGTAEAAIPTQFEKMPT